KLPVKTFGGERILMRPPWQTSRKFVSIRKDFYGRAIKKLSMQRGNRRQRLIGQDGKRDELITSSSLFY
uniref:hypothetical protein n=1 Tax=Prevotella sp. TaxID=59823 RepID=UPI0040280EC1